AEPVPAAWTGPDLRRDDLPDFTELLDQIGWLGGGDEANGTIPNGNGGGHPFEVRVPVGGSGNGHGDGSIPDDPRLRKTLAPWAVEPRDVLLSRDEVVGNDGEGPESLDFTELLKKVGWLQERE
ncbi:MAG: hypothetical protein ACOC83_08455, partial [Gemmatimonadota bacterium]